ncbi:GlxA family transcriptional regulator [Inhella sp.]|uniref:GlxA family transcriptional regulator n=1 Tax=Inhella sp. TaxID=1921806 RepID=UPI0035B07A49
MATTPTTAAEPLRIALLAYPGCLGTELLGLADLLRLAGQLAQAMDQTTGTTTGPALPPPPALELVALRPGPVRLAGGFVLSPGRPRGRYGLLLVPGMELGRPEALAPQLQALADEQRFIRRCAARGSVVATVCLGSFLLAEAGLLDGRRATTSWLFAPAFAARYPQVQLQAQELLVEDGALLSSGAVSSVFDLALHLIKRLYGARVASRTARVTLLQPLRSSQAPYVDERLLPPAPPSFAQAVRGWLEARLAEPFDLARLAAAFHISSRTLLRRIRQETGSTPLALLQQARVQKAKQLLLGSRQSTAQIVAAVGYQDVPTFARLFRRLVGESPARFRQRGR